jgi:nucleoside 2-deoxyribosyltransferase
MHGEDQRIAARIVLELVRQVLIAGLRGRPEAQRDCEQRAATARTIFDADVAGIEWCDVLVACMDGPDPDSGTAYSPWASSKASCAYGKSRACATTAIRRR